MSINEDIAVLDKCEWPSSVESDAWINIRQFMVEGQKPSTNTAMRKLLCEIKIGLSNHCRYDATWRDSVTEDINAVLAQLPQ